MTINPTDTPIEDSPMFAPVPAWERSKKRGMFGGGRKPAARVAPEVRTFDPEPAVTPAAAPFGAEPAVDRLSDVDPVTSTFAAAPTYATRTTGKSSAAPVAIIAGLVLIGGVAAAGWYYTQPHGQAGVAELTPGGSTTTTTAQTTTAPSDAAAPPS
ncbi:MAG: hypothetical protein ACXWKM_11880, partial [Phenylobacterium sp.]